ncbi:MAG TPA: hypothetical protein VFR48_06465, partial [Solirubrobacteraceae bacterium]|nr:hypothetical protein [Solirubrobacteraceae bacterium]
MTLRTRFWLLGMLAAVAAMSVGVAAPAAFGAFEVERFFAANCKVDTCKNAPTRAEELKNAETEGYSQVAGHPPFGITDFKIDAPGGVPSGIVTHVRTDVGQGVSTNPEAVEKCAFEEPKKEHEFGTKEVIPGTGFFPAPTCGANSEIGRNEVVVFTGTSDLPLSGNVYNLVQPTGLASDFGVALELPKPLTEPIIKKIFEEHPIGEPTLEKEIEEGQYYAHTLIEGGVEWAGDYHDYYEINVSPALPLISSRLILEGNIGTTGNGGFITNPSNCGGPGPLTTSMVKLKGEGGVEAVDAYETPIGTEGCRGEKSLLIPPFNPGFNLSVETTQSDQPTGVITEATLAHSPSPTGLDDSQVKNATVTLPEGMTLSPSAAKGLAACSLAQFNVGTRNAVACPSASQIGTATLTVPDLPSSEPLQGTIYLGGGPTVTGPPYEMYVDAESARYGVSVRLRGIVKPDEKTGRLTAEFTDNAEQPASHPKLPEQPFSNLTLSFKGGAFAPLANPLGCGPAVTTATFAPYTGSPAAVSLVSEFGVTAENGAACPTPLPFALTQSTENVPSGGGQASNFTLHLSRADGQQYLSSVSSSLPPGLVGKIPSVPLCPEPAASTGNCPASSLIGRVGTVVGSGKSPIAFSGNVYLTGPTGKGPYGMTIVVNAAIDSFSLGNVVARAAIEINQFTGRVTVTGNVPTIWAGIPLRLKELVVAINRQGFLINPTNCGTLATESRLGAQQGGTQTVSTPYNATGCSSLAFKPSFGASTGAKTSKANGASLVTKLNFHPKGLESNVKSVVVSLPKSLPSRLSTLNHACTEAVFNANPSNCPSNSKVGTARVKTPVLPAQMSGPAYFVSHGGAKFPDLDL